MFAYQNGKLYRQVGQKLVGVDVYSDKVLLVEDSEVELDHALVTMLEPFEVRCKFQINETPYIFPREVKVEEVKVEEVEIKDDTVAKAKTTTRKSPRK